MPANPPPNNPYAKAAGAYNTSAHKNEPEQRQLEGRILLKAAKMLRDLQDDWENVNSDILESTLRYNRQVWMVFYDTALENPEGNRPNDLRSNIINLANFIFKRELDIMAAPEKKKLDILVNINKEIAAGLMTRTQENTSPKKEQPAETQGQSA